MYTVTKTQLDNINKSIQALSESPSIDEYNNSLVRLGSLRNNKSLVSSYGSLASFLPNADYLHEDNRENKRKIKYFLASLKEFSIEVSEDIKEIDEYTPRS